MSRRLMSGVEPTLRHAPVVEESWQEWLARQASPIKNVPSRVPRRATAVEAALAVAMEKTNAAGVESVAAFESTH